MKCFFVIAFSALGAASSVCQTVTGVANAATNLPPILPNSAIAQGALFVVYGSHLGPISLAIANSFPLPKTLGGTSISLTVGSTTVQAIMYYALSTQVAAILPSTVPVGDGTLKLTTDSGSASLPITVVANNIGVFTIDATGTGDAVATLPDNTVVTPTNAPNPGDTVVFWATGLGPVSFDETNPAVQFDMSNVPLQVFIGGKPGTILFRGRNACCSGVDTVYVTVPSAVTAGCVVSVIMQIGLIVSNATTIPVATSGRSCTPANPAISQSDYLQLLAKTGPLNLGQLALVHTEELVGDAGIGNYEVLAADSGGAQFERYGTNPAAVLDKFVDIPAYGSCTVVPYQEATTFTPAVTLPSTAILSPNLDAGSSLAVTGSPGGGITVRESIPKQVSPTGAIAYGASFDNNGTTLIPTRYTIAGIGGADIGAFSVRVNGPPSLNWENAPSAHEINVDRSTALTVSWSGGDPGGYILITGSDTAGGYVPIPGSTTRSFAGATFTCTAKTTDGSFMVPANVLLGIPKTLLPPPIDGNLAVWAISAPVQFRPNGLDLGIATTYTLISYSGVNYY